MAETFDWTRWFSNTFIQQIHLWQYNGQIKRDKRTYSDLQTTRQKTKDWATRTTLKTFCELMWSGLEVPVPLATPVVVLLNYERMEEDICFVCKVNMYQVRVITVFTVFRLLTDFVCLYTYEFWLSLCKIVQSSVILLLPLFTSILQVFD